MSAIRPASPVLASRLLELEVSNDVSDGHNKAFLTTGIKSLDLSLPRDVWAPGRVVGVAGSEGRGGELALNILTSHLISKLAPGTTTPTTSSNVDAIPTVYIISPLASSILTAESLHSNLLSRSLPYEAALQSLDSVSILQVFDLAGLADAISEVADSLHSAQANRDETTSSKAQVPVLIILDSVDSLLEDVTRSSGIPRALSLFVPIQRQITHLSRVYSSFLTTLMVTNTSRASTFGSGRSGVMGSGESTSAFAGNPSTIGMGIVGRSVDEGTDVQLLAEIIDKKTVVEVVKNRVGGGIGRWGIWE